MKNLFLEKYLKGEKSLGTFTHLLSAPAVEALARAGMDYVIIDIEHSPIGAEHAAELVGVAAVSYTHLDVYKRQLLQKARTAGVTQALVGNLGHVGIALSLIHI